MRAGLFVLASVVGVAACGSDDPGGVVLDGSPRAADGFGVVVSADGDGLVLSDGSAFAYADDFASFSTATQELIPVRTTPGAFVYYRLDDDDLAWVASVSQVVQRDDASRAYYAGAFLESDADGRWVFADGTVVTPADGLDAPTTAGTSTIEIDPGRGVAIAVLETGETAP